MMVFMKIIRGYRTKLILNNSERNYLSGCAGLSRFVFNWGLSEWKRQYESGGKPNSYALKKQFNSIKRDLFPWSLEYPCVISQEAFSDLDFAFKNFFRRVKQGAETGYPHYKKKGIRDHFRVRGVIKVYSDKVRLPVIGIVRLAERNYIPLSGVKILSATISRNASDWFISVQVEQEIPEEKNEHSLDFLGIDLGVKAIATCSNGKTFDNPKTLLKHEKRLKRLQRELSRRKKGGCNRNKTNVKIAKLHQKISNIRNHVLHDVSHHVTEGVNSRVIVLEDLNVSGMLKNHHLAKAVSDASFGELRRQIEYKAIWWGNEVIIADRWFPSSKLCSRCGALKDDLTLSDRTYQCDCGNEIDRDLNAALNLAAYGRTREAQGIACGVDVQQGVTKKQEAGTDPTVKPAAATEQSLARSIYGG